VKPFSRKGHCTRESFGMSCKPPSRPMHRDLESRRRRLVRTPLRLGIGALLFLGCGQPVEPLDVRQSVVPSQNISADTLSVSVIKIGKVTLQATLGTRGPQSRLMLSGVDGAGAELELVPSADHSGVGVTSQLMLFAKRSDAGYARLGISIIRESDNNNDTVVLDMTSSGTRPIMELVVKSGEGRNSIRVRSDGTVETVR
jgi:hypothetical protein